MEDKIFILKKRLIFFVVVFHIGLLLLISHASSLVSQNKKESIFVKTVLLKPMVASASVHEIKESSEAKVEKLNQPLPVPIYKKENNQEEKSISKTDDKVQTLEPKIIKKPSLQAKKKPSVKPKTVVKKSTPPVAKTKKREVAKKHLPNKKMVPKKVYTIKNPKIVDSPPQDQSYVADQKVEKLMKDIKGHFEKIDKVQLQQEAKEKKMIEPQEIVQQPAFQSLTVDADCDLPVSNNEAYDLKTRLVSELKQNLELPDYGEVKVLMQISKEGNVMSVKILSSQNEQNSRYLKNSLPKLVFPWFNVAASLDKSFEFTITFKNE